jgi:CrcB protein
MIWSIALGSAVGGVARYLLGGLIQRLHPGPFPHGTLLVNIVGSLALGFLLRYAMLTPGFSPALRAGLTIGFCGGFTTFSTFSVEVVGLIEAGDYRRAALYVALSVGLSVLAAAAGYALARGLVAPPSLSE